MGGLGKCRELRTKGDRLLRVFWFRLGVLGSRAQGFRGLCKT